MINIKVDYLRHLRSELCSSFVRLREIVDLQFARGHDDSSSLTGWLELFLSPSVVESSA